MTNETAAPGRAGSIGLYSGFAFVVLFIAGFVSLGTPEADATDAVWLAHWQDSGNRTKGCIAAIAVALAAVAFMWFLGALRRRLPAGVLGADAAFAAGIAYGTLLLVASLGAGLIPVGYNIADVPVPVDVDLIRLVDGLFFGTMFVPLPIAAAAFLVPFNYAASVVGLLPRWLVYLGYVTALVGLFGTMTFVVPHLLTFIWVVGVSITLLRRG